jgi:catalase
VLLSDTGGERLAKEAAARDFVADAFAHCKFIGFTANAAPLFLKAGVEPDADEGLFMLDADDTVDDFAKACRKLRLWAREMQVKL